LDAEKPESPPPQQPRKRPSSLSRQFAIALELPFVLVSAIVVGGVFGYFLDRWWNTSPLMMVILGGLGFYAGVRDVLRRLAKSGDGDAGSSAK
jgi:F0F1-type ATP synthase assembly protein I